MSVDVSLLAPSRLEERPSASTSCHSYVPLGATAEAGCSEPAETTSAHTFTVTGWTYVYATRPPNFGDRVCLKLGF